MKDDEVLKRIEAKIDRLDGRIEKLDERQDRTEIQMTRNTVSLDEHIRRTALLEADMKPVKSHVQLMNTLAKVASVLLTIALAAKSLGLF